MSLPALFRSLADRLAGKPASPRSPHWPAVRRAHLVREPACAACAACATRTRLAVHHVRPVHLYPELELEPANLLTLCEGPGGGDHLTFGHLGAWAAWSPTVRADAADYLRKRLNRPTTREGGP
jgi:5-methylcytosine-specific restriction protein A